MRRLLVRLSQGRCGRLVRLWFMCAIFTVLVSRGRAGELPDSPDPTLLLQKYEKSLLAYQCFRARWTFEDYELNPGKGTTEQGTEEWRIFRDHGRVRVQNIVGGKKKDSRFFEAVRETGKAYLNVYPDGNLVSKNKVTRDDVLELCGGVPTSPSFGIVNEVSFPEFLRRSTLTTRAESIGGHALQLLEGSSDHARLQVWLDPRYDYAARRIRYEFEPTVNIKQQHIREFNVEQFEKRGTQFVAALAKLIIIRRIAPGQFPAKMNVPLESRGCLRAKLVDLDFNPHFTDVDFRPSQTIANGTKVVMVGALGSAYVWKDGAVQPGIAWKPTTRADQSARQTSATENLASSVRNARVSNMRVLLAAAGDATDAVQETLMKLLDARESKDIRRYLPVVIGAEDLRREAEFFARLKLQPPKAGEILLEVVDGAGSRVDVLHLACRDGLSAFSRGTDFLRKYAPAARDARKLLAAAQKECRKTGRSLWIIVGGSRCGPCFRLARWMDDQHSLLERDYVFVKLNEDCDEYVPNVVRSLNRPKEQVGIPWYAITNASGTVLAVETGFPPESAKEKRHFREILQGSAQKLNREDLDHIIESLGD